MRYFASSFMIVALSTGAYFSYSSPHVSDFIYSLRAPISGDKICENSHFYPLNQSMDHLSDEISLFYAYDLSQSKEVESIYFRIKDQLNFDNYHRYPAVLDSKPNEASVWGEALSQTNMDDRNPVLVEKSYDVFLNKGQMSMKAFDETFSETNINPDIFHRIVNERDFKKDLSNHRELLFDVSPKMIPFILVKGKYLLYPSSFKDIRDGWMIANYLYTNTDERIQSGCKP